MPGSMMAKRLGALGAAVALVGIGVAAMPSQAHAWWRGGCCAVGIGIFAPPVVVAPPLYVPPPVYYPPPVAYAPPQRPWIPPHWEGGYWVPGHWG
jgi:hypothetical protein